MPLRVLYTLKACGNPATLSQGQCLHRSLCHIWEILSIPNLWYDYDYGWSLGSATYDVTVVNRLDLPKGSGDGEHFLAVKYFSVKVCTLYIFLAAPHGIWNLSSLTRD